MMGHRAVGILLAALAAVSACMDASAQHFIGARFGGGAGYGRFAPVSRYNMDMVWGVWSGGVQWKYYGPTRYIGAVAGEVEFIQRAYQNRESLDAEEYYRRIVNTINVPLIWHIHLNMMHDRLRIFLNAGVWASYNFSSTYAVHNADGTVAGDYTMRLVRDNPLGYGLLGGVGLNVVMGRWEFMLEGRYYFSYGDILRNNAVYPGSPTRSPLDNINISVGFWYRLGRKPHTPEPPGWYLRRQAEKKAELLKKQNSENDGNEQTEQSSETDTERPE